jgi:hypothetical protein
MKPHTDGLEIAAVAIEQSDAKCMIGKRMPPMDHSTENVANIRLGRDRV